MLSTIRLLEAVFTHPNATDCQFKIVDSCFTQIVDIYGPRIAADFYYPVAIIATYKSKNLNVPRNLAKYYLDNNYNIDNLTQDYEVIKHYFAKMRGLQYDHKAFYSTKKYYTDFKSRNRKLIV